MFVDSAKVVRRLRHCVLPAGAHQRPRSSSFAVCCRATPGIAQIDRSPPGLDAAIGPACHALDNAWGRPALISIQEASTPAPALRSPSVAHRRRYLPSARSAHHGCYLLPDLRQRCSTKQRRQSAISGRGLWLISQAPAHGFCRSPLPCGTHSVYFGMRSVHRPAPSLSARVPARALPAGA